MFSDTRSPGSPINRILSGAMGVVVEEGRATTNIRETHNSTVMEYDEAQFNCLLQLLSCGYMTTIKTALCQHAGRGETGSGMSMVN